MDQKLHIICSDIDPTILNVHHSPRCRTFPSFRFAQRSRSSAKQYPTPPITNMDTTNAEYPMKLAIRSISLCVSVVVA